MTGKILKNINKNTPKKILHIAPTPFFSDRGCHIRIEGIVRCLDNLAYDNTVCTYHHGRDIEGIKTQRIGSIKAYTKTSAGPSPWKLLADPKLLWLSIKTYRKNKPQVIHAHLHEGLLIGLLVKVLFFWKKTTLIADMQGSLVGELDSHGFFKKAKLLKFPFKLLEGTLLYFSNHIICSSQHALDKFKREFPKSAHKISLAQDGAVAAHKLTDQKINSLKNKIGLPKDKIIAVYSGALLESKGSNELKTLIKSSIQSIENIHFLIVGYPIQDIQTFLNQHSLSDYCTLTGRVVFSELNHYLSVADIAIDPKNSAAGEGSGKMLNYLANRLPVVAFNTINNRQFLGDNALLANDIDEMAFQLKGYAENSQLRQATAELNQNRFAKSLSWDATQEQLKWVYKKCQ